MADWKPFPDDPKTLIDLYKYYEGVGSQARAQMVTTANWMLTFAVGLLVYTAKNAFVVPSFADMCRSSSVLALLAPLAGITLCWLVILTISEFQQHVSRNWMRATRCKELVPDLYRIVMEEGDHPPDLSRGWPDHLRTYAAFEAHQPAEGPRRRAQWIFLLYTYLPWVLGALFAGALALAFALDPCTIAELGVAG